MKLLVLLQNPWFKDGEPRSRQAWEVALWRCQTGKRLIEMLPVSGFEVVVDNANPATFSTPKTIPPADMEHVQGLLDNEQPEVVLLCGKVAQTCAALVTERDIILVNSVHPAYRLLSKRYTSYIRHTLQDVLDGAKVVV